jgi:hypothetical protein
LNDPDFGKDMGWLIEGIKQSMGASELPDSFKLLGYLKKLTPGQFTEVVFFLDEKQLIDKAFLSSPVSPTSNAIEIINLLKQKPDGLLQLVSFLKKYLGYSI